MAPVLSVTSCAAGVGVEEENMLLVWLAVDDMKVEMVFDVKFVSLVSVGVDAALFGALMGPVSLVVVELMVTSAYGNQS